MVVVVVIVGRWCCHHFTTFSKKTAGILFRFRLGLLPLPQKVYAAHPDQHGILDKWMTSTSHRSMRVCVKVCFVYGVFCASLCHVCGAWIGYIYTNRVIDTPESRRWCPPLPPPPIIDPP